MVLKVCMHGVEMSPSKENVIAGGVPNSVIRLTKALYGIGIESILITNDRKFREIHERTNDFTIPWMDTHLVLVNGKYAGVKYSITYLLKIIQGIKRINVENELDIIHGHSGHLGLMVATEVASRYVGIPAVHTIYCPVKTKSKKYFYKHFLRGTKKIIAISYNIKQSLSKIGIPSCKIEVIPPLIDFSIFKPGVGGENLRDTLGIGDEFAILFLGNLTKTKGIDTVLDALNIVKKRYPYVKLIAGIEMTHSGSDIRKMEILNKIKRCNLTQNVIELGLISNVEKVIDAVDVVVAPFQNTYNVADYPLVVLESMAVGTPVITTKVGGIPEIITDRENGILIDPDDPVTLSYEIMALIDNPEIGKEMGKRAASFVREKFPEKRIVEMTKQVYEAIVSE